MLETWRWFGPDDLVTLDHIKQAGAVGVVTALHHCNRGGAWPEEEVAKRRADIERAGLVWSVVESIAVPENIKTREAGCAEATDAYKKSIRAVARAGVRTICYNFMAITDWTRTDLMYRLPTGGYALRFDAVTFAAYDLFVLRRAGAEQDHPPERRRAAEARFRAMSESDIAALERILIDWLPAREFVYDRASFQRMLDVYRAISPADLRANLVAFLKEIVPIAEEEGALLCIHPDDPAFPIFGLPRVLSTAADVDALFAAVPEHASGLTLCTGSFGANPANDLVAMAQQFGPRTHFAHLRNTRREPDGSFHEAEHLDGDTDMIGVVAALLREENRRAADGRKDAVIPMRPDHGHLLAEDIGKPFNPGYSCIGRLKGLAELRGVMRTVAAFRSGRVS
ncbi:MAG: mannonate dehydratase [Acidisphaera sp.]|nr:mannonate dehydratase [Acidisphaera sp.]